MRFPLDECLYRLPSTYLIVFKVTEEDFEKIMRNDVPSSSRFFYSLSVPDSVNFLIPRLGRSASYQIRKNNLIPNYDCNNNDDIFQNFHYFYERTSREQCKWIVINYV